MTAFPKTRRAWRNFRFALAVVLIEWIEKHERTKR